MASARESIPTNSLGAVESGGGHCRFRGHMTNRFQSNDVSAEALFRFRVVSEVLTEVMRGQVRGCAIKRVASRSHAEPDGSCYRASCSSPRAIKSHQLGDGEVASGGALAII